MCHNVVELVKSNTKYCCRQPDIVGDKIHRPLLVKTKNVCRQPDIVGDKFMLSIINPRCEKVGRQPDIVGDKP